MSTLPSETVPMKIGVVGLIPPQIQQMRNRLPGYALEFLPRDNEQKSSNVTTFVKSMDKVVLMTRFISHSTSDKVPPEKRVMITGGTSMAVHRIKELLGCPLAPKVNLTPATPAPQLPPLDKGIPGMTDLLAKAIHGTHAPLVVKPKPDGTYDFTILAAAAAGDVIRFPHPIGMDYASWVTRMRSARFYYAKRTTLHLTLELHEAHADFKVTDPHVDAEPDTGTPPADRHVESTSTASEETPTTEPATTVEETPTPAPEEHPFISPHATGEQVVNADRGEPRAEERPFLPHRHVAATAAGDPLAKPAVDTARPRELVGQFHVECRQLWREVFVSYVQRGLPVPLSATEADNAVRLYRDKFGSPA